MTGRSPARLLAPVALVAAAVALFAIVASGDGGSASSTSPSSASEPEVTATPTPKREKDSSEKPSGETYTVEPGDTPSSIAAELDIDPDALLEANPGVEADALTVGQELVVP